MIWFWTNYFTPINCSCTCKMRITIFARQGTINRTTMLGIYQRRCVAGNKARCVTGRIVAWGRCWFRPKQKQESWWDVVRFRMYFEGEAKRTCWLIAYQRRGKKETNSLLDFWPGYLIIWLSERESKKAQLGAKGCLVKY